VGSFGRKVIQNILFAKGCSEVIGRARNGFDNLKSNTNETVETHNSAEKKINSLR
jgi:hypothetical protein